MMLSLILSFKVRKPPRVGSGVSRLDIIGRHAAAAFQKDDGFRCRSTHPTGSETILVYSITLSARTRNVSGIVSPSAFAVVRLTTKSNLVGCSTGMSAGLVPRRI